MQPFQTMGHIALLPWLAFGHLIPFLHLAVALAGAGLRITYLSTPRNIRRLPAGFIPDHLSSRIQFIDLTLTLLDGLPENAEATVDLTDFDQFPALKIAYQGLKDQLKNFLSGDDKPDHLIYDLLAHWAPEATAEAGDVKCTAFSIFPSSSLAFIGWPPEGVDTENEENMKRWHPSPESLITTPEWIKFPTKMVFRRWEAEQFYSGFFGSSPVGLRDVTTYVRSIENSSNVIAVRDSVEFNAEFLDLLQNLIGKPVIPVGWLPPTVISSNQTVENRMDERWENIRQWLDGKAENSVVFVSFGSEYRMDRAALFEVAYGLELSNLSFLWLLRRPGWLSSDEDDDKALPDGFRSRVQGRGLVNFSWGPQLEILAHESVGGTLFHVGWSSVIESLGYGIVLVMLPGVIDQGLIARLLVEKGLGVEVERNENDGWFDRNGVAEALKTAMASDKTENLREKATEMSVVLGDRRVHDKYIKDFVDYLSKV